MFGKRILYPADQGIQQASRRCQPGVRVRKNDARVRTMAVRYKPLEKIVSGVGKSPTCFEMDYEGHVLVTDEPASRNGTDLGPPPFDTFIAVLSGCSHVILGLIAKDLDVRIEDVKIRSRLRQG